MRALCPLRENFDDPNGQSRIREAGRHAMAAPRRAQRARRLFALSPCAMKTFVGDGSRNRDGGSGFSMPGGVL